MRTAALKLCLSGFLVAALPSLTRASLEYSAKTDLAALFRSETLDPPPLAILDKGESLKLIHRGAAHSQVETAGGLKGWMKNEDLLAVESASGQKMAFGDQKITGGGEFNHSPLIQNLPMDRIDVLDLDRSFESEIIEAIDKEQLEMKNGDN
ncbi:MAG: hypothetical protein JWO30_127 [Fibrobacteres bacterium]|nr:hypothetical protein [Fibrobacterota bacterium]